MTDQKDQDSNNTALQQKSLDQRANVALNGIRWLYLRGGSVGLSNLQTERQINGHLVKSSHKRLVLCSHDGVFVKQVCYRGLRSLGKSLTGGTACKEGRMNQRLARRGVNVPDLIAYGVVKRFGFLQRDLLLTEKVNNAESLEEFAVNRWESTSFREKNQFIRDFANFIRTIHKKGVEHTDLHLGNILVRKNSENQFYLLDLDRVKLHDGLLNDNQTTKNLALLLCTFQSLSSSLERFRFLKYYYDVKHLREASSKLTKIEQAALKIASRIWAKKATRCLYSNSKFVRGKSRSFKFHCVNRIEVEKALEALLPDPDNVLNNGVMLKDGRTVRAAKVRINGQYYFLKRYNCKGTIYRIRNGFRRSRAARTWFSTWSLAVRGVPVPQALICLVERRLGLLERSYILYSYVDACRLCDIWPLMNDLSKKRCLSKLAIVLGGMHRSGGYHGDLKWPNILIKDIQGKYSIVLSDLDGSRIYSGVPPRKVFKDIGRLISDLEKTGEYEELKSSFLETWQKWSGMSLE